MDWDTTRVIDARIGDYVVVARRERGGQTWFVGAITDEEGRTLDVPLSFLTPGRRYVAEIYADGPKANWLDNPLPVTITRRPVTSATRLRVDPGAGRRPGDSDPAGEMSGTGSEKAHHWIPANSGPVSPLNGARCDAASHLAHGMICAHG